jgi:hypothetical protein
LGVQIEWKKDGLIHLTQPQLINQRLKDLRLDQENVTTKDVPAISSKILMTIPQTTNPWLGSYIISKRLLEVISHI